jgi:uncharacterized protein YigE (DUF2233 family)
VSPRRIVFALSDEPVTFYAFASLFRDELHCPDALYLDGTISEFFVPGAPAPETVPATHFAGIIAVTVPRESKP